jgi:L-alanine-DL-glutamate epimerase-like enolase superfamily enzyme
LKGSPFIDKIAADGGVLDNDGMLPIPERPGLGVTLNLEALEEYTGVKSILGQGIQES